MGSLGSDSAIEASDIVIMTDEISKIEAAIQISKKTKRIVMQNISMALLIKIIAIVFRNIWNSCNMASSNCRCWSYNYCNNQFSKSFKEIIGGICMENDIIDKCEETVVHPEIVEKLKKQLLTENKAYNLSEFFKIFGDLTRIKIIQLLSLQELCVCDIATILNISQSATSHQLKILRQFGVAKPRKDGKMMYYSVKDEHIARIFTNGLEHISE